MTRPLPIRGISRAAPPPPVPTRARSASGRLASPPSLAPTDPTCRPPSRRAAATTTVRCRDDPLPPGARGTPVRAARPRLPRGRLRVSRRSGRIPSPRLPRPGDRKGAPPRTPCPSVPALRHATGTAARPTRKDNARPLRSRRGRAPLSIPASTSLSGHRPRRLSPPSSCPGWDSNPQALAGNGF